MSDRMTRQRMIKLLHELDNELNVSLEIEICGSSCAILNHGLDRTSTDIDVLRSSISFSTEELIRAIQIVASHNATEQLWINDDATELLNHIPADYKPDTSPIYGEVFDNLNPKVISKADFVITKLIHHERIRQWDISDIRSLKISESDERSIYKKLDSIATKKQYTALMIEANFKAIRGDLVKTTSGYSFANANEIAEYAYKRYQIKPSISEITEWQHSLDNMTAKASSMIAKLDLNAAQILRKGDNQLSDADKSYRLSRDKHLDLSYDL
jgi:DNA polymerase III delta prime subunit